MSRRDTLEKRKNRKLQNKIKKNKKEKAKLKPSEVEQKRSSPLSAVEYEAGMRAVFIDHINTAEVPRNIFLSISEDEVFMMQTDEITMHYKIPKQELLNLASSEDRSKLNILFNKYKGKKIAGYIEDELPLMLFGYDDKEIAA
ncbi:hypothetical protein [Colwellia sp. MB3u-55]|jgi:hypothetical protein|uniref:hypothetical protein n=1 Tax=Colwellia sp. MB3u-55 TaxID=2759810 RepID=UPI0015F660C0|nr:hypothetical protein [Colwellia sp. MB3u-55]MBA6253124.1 hypothetical protein [Colwellia sp. MB3u-55]